MKHHNRINVAHSVCPYSVWSCSWLGRPCAQVGCWSTPRLRAAESAVRLCPGRFCPPSTAGSLLLHERRPYHSSQASLLPHLPSASACRQLKCKHFFSLRHKRLLRNILKLISDNEGGEQIWVMKL